MIKAYKLEILAFSLLCSFVLCVYLLCDWQQSQKVINFLKTEDRKYTHLKTVDHLKLVQKELKRRSSYYFFNKRPDLFISYIQNIYKGQATIKGVLSSDKLHKDKHVKKFRWMQDGQEVLVEVAISERVLAEAFASFFKKNNQTNEIGLSFCLESPIPEISAKSLRLMRDIAPLRNGAFQIPDGERFVYHVYPIANTSLHRVTQISNAEIEKDFIWSMTFWAFVCLFFYYLIWYFVSYKKSRLNYFHRIQLIQVLLFYGCIGLFWQSSTMYDNYDQQVTTRAHELDVLEGRSLQKLHFSYDELRNILPLEKDVIYQLNQLGFKYYLKIQDKNILGKKLVAQSVQDKDQILLLVVLFFGFQGVLYLLLRDYSLFYIRAAKAIDNQFEGFSEDDLLRDMSFDLRIIQSYFIDVFHSLKDRSNKQTFLTKQIYEALLEKKTELDMENYNSKDVFTLYLQLSDVERIEDMASKNYFLKQNYMIQVIRGISARQGGQLFHEEQYSFCVFFAHQRKSVALQRSIISAMNIVKDLAKEDLSMKAYIFFEQLSFSLAQTQSKKDLILHSSFNDKKQVISKENYGVFLEESEGQNLDTATFEKLDKHGYMEVVSVKDIENHLLLLSSGSVELQKSVLDLVSLKQDDLVFESILNNISEFDESLSDQVAMILGTYFDDYNKRQQLLEKLQSIKSQSNSFAIRIVLKCYKKLTFSLSDEELNMISSLDFKEFEEDILHLCLDGESTQRSSIHEQRVKNSTTKVQAHFYILQFEKDKDPQYLNKLYQCFETVYNENNEDNLAYVLGLFLRIGAHENKELLSIFTQWFEQNNAISFYLKKGIDHPKRNIVFLYLAVISSLQLQDMIEVLVAKYQRTLDQELQSEILETLMHLGSDNFLIQCLR
ncbi:MAG: hypothetical protein KC646_02875 [Candidatus Cloacimonetes bacterium]|nr:hypothetical protein [Candidatus Cloacimonadota bacterium]